VCFTAPARLPLYFQALDARNYAVQTMRSWTTLMPGENQSCVGCHEHKNATPASPPQPSLAMEAGPEDLTPFYGPPRGFSFAREVQPILDRHCVRCHDGTKNVPLDLSGEPVLLGPMKRRFSRSYLALTNTRRTKDDHNGDHEHKLVNWIDCMSGPAMLPPYHRGAATSGLMALLEKGHEDVALTGEEREKIACWIDLLVPYCGDYREANAWSPRDHELYARFEAKRERMEAQERTNIEALIRHEAE
jgi:hypothetical protein